MYQLFLVNILISTGTGIIPFLPGLIGVLEWEKGDA